MLTGLPARLLVSVFRIFLCTDRVSTDGLASLIGIVYKTWVTPVKKHPGVYNTRTGLGGFADRVGALAYALTPFTVALASRESVLSLITGVPYQHFNFLHRWTGRVIFVQSFLHTLGWTIVEAKLYQPQPSVYKSFMAEQYIIFGVVAMFFVTVLTIFSTKRAIEWTGYEVFRKVHYLVALLYIGACWGHWDKLSFWMYASLILFFLDRFARLIRTALLHFGFRKGENGIGFRSATATVQHLGDDDDSLVRLDFDFKHGPWRAGQHFYLCFPALSVWQSHPLTPSSLPVEGEVQHHTYLIRTRKGMTAELAALAKAGDGSSTTTPVILTGPYGRAFSDNAEKNVLAVAGGTGITFTLPVLLDILARPVRMTRAIDFTWIVRSTQDLLWLAPELSSLKARIASQETPNLRLRIFVTREASSSVTPSSAEKVKDVPAVTVSCARDSEKAARSSAAGLSLSLGDLVASVPGFEVMYLGGRHPSIENLVAEFEERADVAGGASQVVGSGPEAIGTELRDAAAKRNRPGKVWEGDEEGSMGMYWDSRE